jgi:NCS1 family nucleobase:cation symporter-1
MFVPLFGVVLTDYFLLRRRRLDLHALDHTGGAYWYFRGYHRAALLAWVAGFSTYESIQLLGVPVGGSIPSMLLAGALYYGIARRYLHHPRGAGNLRFE